MRCCEAQLSFPRFCFRKASQTPGNSGEAHSEGLLPVRTHGHQRPALSKPVGCSASASCCERDNISLPSPIAWCQSQLALHHLPHGWKDPSETRDLSGIFPYVPEFAPSPGGGRCSVSAVAAEGECGSPPRAALRSPRCVMALGQGLLRGAWSVFAVEAVGQEKEEPLNITTCTTFSLLPQHLH